MTDVAPPALGRPPRVVVVSAGGEVWVGPDLGADHLVGPVGVAELRARVRALLRRTLQPPAAVSLAPGWGVAGSERGTT